LGHWLKIDEKLAIVGESATVGDPLLSELGIVMPASTAFWDLLSGLCLDAQARLCEINY
jgi:hypothetical protein